jgi:hypothetical protein
MPSYQERVVAFIDILGFKNLVERSESEPKLLERLVEVLEEIGKYSDLQKSFEANGQGAEYFKDMFSVSTFSDSILLSAKCDPLGLMLITAVVASMCNRLLHQGVLTRGAISKGKMIHAGGIAIGEGLIKAYQIESSTAIYPRIIIDDSLLYIPGVNLNEFKKRMKKDFDGLWYLHIFEENIMKLTEFSAKNNKVGMPQKFMEAGRREIENSIKGARSLSVKAKAAWLARYFNQYAPEFGLAPISAPD